MAALAEEHGDGVDFVLVSPRDPAARRRIATAQHRSGWDVYGSLSPDGRTIVYAVLPRSATSPDTEGEMWTVPLTGRGARRLANGIDLRSSLIWSPDSAWVSYERVNGPEIQVRRVNVSGAGDQLLARGSAADRWFPIGYTPDGRSLLLAHLTSAGTEVVTQGSDGSMQGRVTVAPSSSRGFTVSPDGRPALLVLTDEEGRKVYRAVAQAPDGSFTRLTTGGKEDTGLAWNPRTGECSVGAVPDSPGAAVGTTPGARTMVPPAGFDVPVAWSPDGAYLALRHYDGESTDRPGSETLQIVRGDGARAVVSGDKPSTFLGWALIRG